VKLAEQVEAAGGRALSLFQDPVGNHWHLFCLLPLSSVEAPPFQRNLSPTHLKRLGEVMRKVDRFTEPIVVVSPRPGVFWTPNGNHRRAALEKVKGKSASALIPSIVVLEPEVGYSILPLNTEKAPNLKDKSLEVIRLYKLLAEEDPRASEESYAFQFESAHFLTLGLLYEENARFAGGAFAPILKRVDRFLKGTLRTNLGERMERADQVREADRLLTALVQKVKRRGLNHPYLKTFLLSRTTPLTRARKSLPSFSVTFRKLAENLEGFDASKIRYEDVARSALIAPAGD